jgi:hypothetical protein
LKTSKQDLLPIGLIILVGALIFLPFATRLGFYRDDWYMLWSAITRGANSIIDLFSIDRPFMGYTYALTYRLLGNSPLPWQIYAYVLKILGALAVYGILRLIWPENNRAAGYGAAATAGALIYLLYPGFLGQPNAATKTNQLLSLTAELWSICLSGLALRARHKIARPALVIAALLLALLNYLLYEYMIGLEVLRLCVLWLVPQNERAHNELAHSVSVSLSFSGRLRRLVRDGWPYLALILGFLVWRLVFFQSGRGATNQFSVLESIQTNLRSILVYIGLESIIDPLETVFFAWAVPFEQYAALEKSWRIGIALFAGAGIAALALFGLELINRVHSENRSHGENEQNSLNGQSPFKGRSHAAVPGAAVPGAAVPGAAVPGASSVFFAGALSLYGAMFPVLAVGRDVDFSGGFDKYTLHASPAVAILLSAIIFGYLRGRSQQVLLGLLLFLGASTQILNAYHWQRFWENEKTLWWQLWWRAPDLKDGTILLASLPEDSFYEDYEMWGPANLIYRPGVKDLTIGAEVLNPDTIWKDWAGVVEMRGMRNLGYQRDYNKSLLLALPSDNSCLKVVDRNDLILPLRYEPRLVPILRFSYAEQIDLSSSSTAPPEAIFGLEPPHDWCYYYQNAERLKQAGDWESVVRLGDEAIAASLTPNDRAEWLPFLEGYLWAGNEEKVRDVGGRLEAPLVKEICDALAQGQSRFDESIQQALTLTLCTR